MSNALLETHLLPPFSRITPDLVVPAIESLIEEGRREIEEILGRVGDEPTWESFVRPLENLQDRLSQAWSPVGHMNAVVNSEPLRDAYNACLPMLSAYATEVGQHEGLFRAYETLAASDEYARLDTAQRKSIDNALRDFRLSGIDLPDDRKQRYGEIKQRLSQLSSTFGEHVLDATKGWTKHVTSAADLAGLPESAMAVAEQTARACGLDGYVLTLEFPCYQPVVTYCDDRELRREIYEAFVTRASDVGPGAGKLDNGPLMNEILALRQELAEVLGFVEYAEYSLATKMAETPQEVLDFVLDLARRTRAQAENELEELRTFAREQHGAEDLEAWDVAYYSEKLKQSQYEVSQEVLRPYFPVPRVLAGLFATVERLFGISVDEIEEFDGWHADARLFEVSRDGEPIGRFYLDLYARPDKRGGAWMDDCRIRRRLDDGGLQLPVAYLVCNFTPPVGDRPALLTHYEVTTIFHEFGHGLHHLLTQVEVSEVSGINGVAWDAVELPSQFMENWCWSPEALAMISGHHETGEPLPQDLLDRMLAARNFQSGLAMLRQLEYTLLDLRLHMAAYRGRQVQQILDEARAEVAVLAPPDFNRFQHGFTHIFGGGYAAGYYSYKWAQVLSADAFSLFEERGVFDQATGEHFRDTVLASGGSRDAMDLFVEFRGRKPTVDALLRHTGIA